MKDNFIRILLSILGFFITALGSVILILCDLGTDPFTVMLLGLIKKFPVSIGLLNSLMSFVLVCIVFFIDKKFIKIGTVIALVIFGPSMNFWMFLLTPIYNSLNASFILRLLIFIIGLIIIAFAVSIISIVNLGVHPNDTLPLLLTIKFQKFSLRTTRMFYDATQLIIGFLLGGALGIGTILCCALLGPLLQFFIPICKKQISKCISDKSLLISI